MNYIVFNICIYYISESGTCSISHVLATPWTIALQGSLSMEFSRQEYWSRLPFPTPGNLPDIGIEHTSLASPALASRFFTTVPPRNIYIYINYHV